MNLSALSGNEALKRQLTLQTARRGLSHAYILSGPAGSGKHTLARLLAAALVCTGPEQRPCLACPGCRKAMGGIHPDVIWTGGDGKDITVAQIRSLRTDAYIRPNEAERKVYILENAHTMNQSAQNAMLKLLEEGPAYAAFLLLAENAAALLPTVRSRCETLTLSPVTPQQAEDYLARRWPERPKAEIRAAALSCEGLLGRAVAALEGGGEGDQSLTQTACSLLGCLSGHPEGDLAELCISLEKWDRDRFAALMDELLLLLRDALVCQSGAPAEADPVRSEAAGIAAASCDGRQLLRAVQLTERLREACGFHVGVGHLCGWLCAGLSDILYPAKVGGNL